jgi:hypothetical protein
MVKKRFDTAECSGCAKYIGSREGNTQRQNAAVKKEGQWLRPKFDGLFKKTSPPYGPKNRHLLSCLASNSSD